ncbi:MAG: hypothetical protein GX220_06935 [Treponema sp.]|nr:hypothetical protein [Treponema sp.]
MKRFLLFFLCINLSFSYTFALGKKEVESKSVQRLDSWQETFDLTSRRQGKYNILVTATDIGGNTAIAGPYNIFIDPDSDLPITGIANPLNGMTVPGNLNIVGTCVDDDGVGKVYIIFDGNKDEPIIAQGTEFWSYYLDTKDLNEGPHTIEVYAEDIYGVVGKSQKVTWNLNRQMPVTKMTSHTMGTLVSGKQKLEGTISDGNGIIALLLSIDGGKTFEEVPIIYESKTGITKFVINVDTTKIPDGPQIFWFKAFDGQGVPGLYSFLFFVDNTFPEVRIVWPKSENSVNGKFTVAGYANDIIGLQSITWEFNGKKGELPVIPGNPYWAINLDVRGQNIKVGELKITAQDTAGNIARTNQKINIKQEDDFATVNVVEPKENFMVQDPVLLKGFASDDDGIAKVVYTLDGSAPVEIESAGAFFDNISEKFGTLTNGEHTLKIWAIDIHDVKGHEKVVKFVVPGPPPAINVTSVNKTAYVKGMKINPESNGNIAVSVVSDSGLASLSWKFAGMNTEENVTVNKGNTSFNIPIEKAIQWGVTELKIIAIDIYERKTEKNLIFYLENLTKTRGNLGDVLPDAVQNDNGNANIFIESIGNVPYKPACEVILEKATDTSNLVFMSVVVESEIPVTGATYSINNSSSAKVAPRQDETTATKYYVDVPLVNLDANLTHIGVIVERGKSPTLSVTGTISVLRYKEPRLINDNVDVYWTESIKNGQYYYLEKDKPLYGYVNSGAEIVKAEIISAEPGLFVTFENNIVFINAEKEGEFNNVALRITDSTGNDIATKSIKIRSDFAAPIIELLEPTKATWVKNSMRISGLVDEVQKIAKAEYSVDGGVSWNPVKLNTNAIKDGKIPFDQIIDLSKCEDGLILLDIRMADASGKESTVHRVLQKDTIPPEVTVILPEAGTTVNGETLIVMKVKDNGLLERAEYIRSDGGKGIDRTPPKVEKTEPQYDENGVEIIQTTEEIVEIPKDEIEIGQTGRFELYMNPLISTRVGTVLKPIENDMIFEFSDASGNKTRYTHWDFNIDAESDKPVAEIHVPAEMEIITTDFTVSGIVYDDDGPCKIWYSIDKAPFIAIDKLDTSFEIDMKLADFTDNEHTIRVVAEDSLGVKGDEIVRTFRVSLAEPRGEVLTPSIDETVKGLVQVSGKAYDKNGIDKVQISFDNGNTFNDVAGQEDWTYEFDTRIYQDGTYVVFIKVWDNYGIQGLYSSLINIDNTKPQINLELPLDDSTVTGNLFFSGQTTDNIGLKKLELTIRNLDKTQVRVPDHLAKIDLVPDEIISKVVDISDLSDGFYNIQVRGEDAGGNVSHVSRNIKLDKSVISTKVDILYPLNGEHVQGMFNLYGEVISDKSVESLLLYIDGVQVGEPTTLTDAGYFRFTITPELLTGGSHNFVVRALIDGDKIVSSSERYLIYTACGPWVTIDNFSMGDFAVDRPYLEGRAGYALTEDELMAIRAKGTSKLEKEQLRAKTVSKIEVSMDNGKTFVKVSNTKKWRYRVENGDMPAGFHFMLVRATMENGETAVTRTIIQIDKTKPFVRLISPGEGERFNESLEFQGLSSDNIALKSVELTLRSGDKSQYEIPAFIQGLYFDMHFWGATLYDVGAGLTFFDDNVKLQVQFGQFTQQQYNMMENVFDLPMTMQRYGGNVIGMKLLANIAYVPFRYFFGPSWEWLSANFAMGANFSRFDNTQSGKAQILTALIAQLEFPRITVAKQKYFRTFSFYTEFQLWFIPTDVESSVNIESLVPQISGGIRMNVF